jgi:hypothetical protein
MFWIASTFNPKYPVNKLLKFNSKLKYMKGIYMVLVKFDFNIH